MWCFFVVFAEFCVRMFILFCCWRCVLRYKIAYFGFFICSRLFFLLGGVVYCLCPRKRLRAQFWGIGSVYGGVLVVGWFGGGAV